MMHELQPHPRAGHCARPAAPPGERAATIMTRLEHWRHVLKEIERDAADSSYAEVKLLLGMAILAIEDAMGGFGT